MRIFGEEATTGTLHAVSGVRRRIALVLSLALLSSVLALAVGPATAVQAQTPREITRVVSCLAGNGRVDTTIVNPTGTAANYRVEFEGLAPRPARVAPGDWIRIPITGRSDGDYTIVTSRDDVVISTETVTVACDENPTTAGAEVTPIVACRAGNGFVLIQLLNNSGASKSYVIEFQGVNNRSTTAPPYGAAVKAVTGRPDGAYALTVKSGSTVVATLPITVNCDPEPPSTSLNDVQCLDGGGRISLRVTNNSHAAIDATLSVTGQPNIEATISPRSSITLARRNLDDGAYTVELVSGRRIFTELVTVRCNNPTDIALSAPENTRTIANPAVDVDAESWELVGGADRRRFIIAENLTDLVFVTSPDFERPQDANGDNVYEVELLARNSAGETNIIGVQVTITDVPALLEFVDADVQGGLDHSVGQYVTLLKGNGDTRIAAHWDAIAGDVLVLACDDRLCDGDGDTSARIETDAPDGQFISMAVNAAGNPVIAWHDYTNFDLVVMACNDPGCTGGDDIPNRIETPEADGQYTSIALNSSGHPVISHRDITNGDVAILTCNDPACVGNDDTTTRIETPLNDGLHTALALDDDDNPVVVWQSADHFGGLAVAVCNDATCAGGDDIVGIFGFQVSRPKVVIGDDGTATVVANSFGQGGVELASLLLRCSESTCTEVDISAYGAPTLSEISLALSSAGNPVMAYTNFNEIIVLTCNDPSCTGGDETVTRIPTVGTDLGEFSSMVLDPVDLPTVAFWDLSNLDLRMLVCNDSSCSGDPNP